MASPAAPAAVADAALAPAAGLFVTLDAGATAAKAAAISSCVCPPHPKDAPVGPSYFAVYLQDRVRCEGEALDSALGQGEIPVLGAADAEVAAGSGSGSESACTA